MCVSARFLIQFGLLAAWACVASPALLAGQAIDAATQARVVADYGKLPMAFEANQGQADPEVQFLARGQGYGLYLTPTEAVLSLRAPTLSGPRSAPNAVVRMRLAGSNPRSRLSGVDPLPGMSNYFIGNNPARWHSAVPNYAKVLYANVYPGIDLVYYGNQRQLEYDFIVAPGADPRRIVLDFKGIRGLTLDSDGNLLLATATGNVLQHKPIVHQNVDGVRQSIDGRYRLRGRWQASFEIARYDTTRPLIIDPLLAYSTYLGGSGSDYGYGIAVDGSGCAYVTGETTGNFPTTPGAYRNAFGGGNYAPFTDAFVTKLNATGTALIYSTYLGGSGSDSGHAITVDRSGNAYVTGYTRGNFPTTPGAYQTTYDGFFGIFVTKLHATGAALAYSTYLSSAGRELSRGIAVDNDGNAYVTGRAEFGFPTTPGAYQSSYGGGADVFVTKFNATGTALVYSTFLGGSAEDTGNGIVVDDSGSAYVTGMTAGGFPTTPGAFQSTYGGSYYDAFVTKLNPAGSALVYSSYLGGSSTDYGYGIAVDSSGNVYVTGQTWGNFPTTPMALQTIHGGNYDAFVTKLDGSGSRLVYSTYVGGTGFDHGYGIAVDGDGSAYVTGQTRGGGFPTTANAPQIAYGGGYSDAFIAKLDSSGTALTYSTYLGGPGEDAGHGIAADGNGNVYVTGYTYGSFPTTPGAYLNTAGGGVQNAFVALLGEALPTPVPSVIEYYHAGFDHYFITWMPNEIAILDAGTKIKGWARTGYSFNTHTTVQSGTSPVCRYYIPPGLGDSHFFGRGTVECNATGQKNPSFVLEDPAFMYMFLPATGVCPTDTTPIYRVFQQPPRRQSSLHD